MDLTIKDVCEALNIHRDTLKKLESQGKITSHVRGSRKYFPYEEIMRFRTFNWKFMAVCHPADWLFDGFDQTHHLFIIPQSKAIKIPVGISSYENPKLLGMTDSAFSCYVRGNKGMLADTYGAEMCGVVVMSHGKKLTNLPDQGRLGSISQDDKLYCDTWTFLIHINKLCYIYEEHWLHPLKKDWEVQPWAFVSVPDDLLKGDNVKLEVYAGIYGPLERREV